MSKEVDFIKDRAVKTISVARQLGGKWVWAEADPDAMQLQLETIIGNSTATPPLVGQEEIASQAEGTQDHANGLWEQQLNEQHRRTVQALGMARTKYRNDPVSLAVLRGLTANSHSHTATLAEALAWESAWARLDTTWSPTTINTFAAFKVLRKQCAEDLQTDASDTHAAWRTEVVKLNAMANDLEELLEAWYADAQRMFGEGTPEGTLIRAAIPTTYTPPTPPVPPDPAPSASPTKTP